MKELIFIGGFAQNSQLNKGPVKELQRRGYKVKAFTLSEFYKTKEKNKILEDKIVVTHSIGLAVVPVAASISSLVAVNPPEPTKMLIALKRVSLGSRFDKSHGVVTHTLEIALHPIIHWKFWRINTKFSATETLLSIAKANPKARIQLLYSSEDKVVDHSQHRLSDLKDHGIHTYDTKGYHREIHTNPEKVLGKAII